jgi:hypothetical protein
MSNVHAIQKVDLPGQLVKHRDNMRSLLRRRHFLMCISFQRKLTKLFKAPILVVLVLTSLLIGCSDTPENPHAGEMVFQGEGAKWEVSIPNEVTLKHGKKYFSAVFRFKGDPGELNEVEYISFALGTDQGTQIVNVYDPAYKEKLMKIDGFQEEYEDRYGIIVNAIKNRKTDDFKLEYVFEEEESGYDTFDSIKENGVMIAIQWEDRENNYEDRIHSQ